MLSITSIYAGLLGLFLVALSSNVIRYRALNRVSVGDGGHKALEIAIRSQGNFVEYAPLGLILLAICELQSASALTLHLSGAALFLSRILHAIGMLGSARFFRLRQIGMITTFGVIMFLSAWLLINAL